MVKNIFVKLSMQLERKRFHSGSDDRVHGRIGTGIVRKNFTSMQDEDTFNTALEPTTTSIKLIGK